MADSLSQRIQKRTVLQNKKSLNRNKALFLLLKNDIEEAMKDGWSMLVIWETLVEEGKIDYSYQTFRGYVNRLLLVTERKRSNATNRGETASTDAGFSFNPTPNLKELI